MISSIRPKSSGASSNIVYCFHNLCNPIFFTMQVNLEVIMEDTVAALDNKNPSIKAETALFLARCFSRCTQATLPKKMLKAYVTPLLKVF